MADLMYLQLDQLIGPEGAVVYEFRKKEQLRFVPG